MEKRKLESGKFLLILGILILLANLAFALELPKGVQAMVDFATHRAEYFSIALGVIGGLLSILSPCAFPVIGAFFAFTFKEKKNLVKMTLVFFIGLAFVYMMLGVA